MAIRPELEDMLVEGSRMLGVNLEKQDVVRFFTYSDLLIEWNRKMNLTAITDEEDVVKLLFLDSLTPMQTLRRLGIRSFIDIGTGAGFPGLPLKIAEPGFAVTLLDSVEKKTLFIKHVIRTLQLSKREDPTSLAVVFGRAQDPIVINKCGQFDCVITRAFSDMDTILTLSRPYLKENGWIVAMKGPSVGSELDKLPSSIRYETIVVEVPFADRKTTLIAIKP